MPPLVSPHAIVAVLVLSVFHTRRVGPLLPLVSAAIPERPALPASSRLQWYSGSPRSTVSFVQVASSSLRPMKVITSDPLTPTDDVRPLLVKLYDPSDRIPSALVSQAPN